jgi:KaiC/GvpD/RAD55 family RecA-like ATPase
MYDNNTYSLSPLKILEASPAASLEVGDLGVIMGRAGLGKTGLLVQFALDALLSGQRVFHVALGQDIARVQSWYGTLFDDRATALGIGDRATVIADMTERRIIQTYVHDNVSIDKLERALSMYREHTGFSPDMIIVDEPDWTGSVAATAALLGGYKALAERERAVVWMSVQTHRDDDPPPRGQLPEPCQAVIELIDVALRLKPEGDHVTLLLKKDRDGIIENPPTLPLQADTLRLARKNGEQSVVSMPAKVATMLSGGAKGAEEAFGELAERWGVKETNYSFEGRPVARQRGVVQLTEAQLKQGNVSERYLQEHMQRTYPNTPLFRRVLQSIWHQVNTSNQVFVVGLLLDNGTVKGGTGWAAELAKHLGKPLHVYDQEKGAWFTWNGAWVAEDAPRIRARRFTGTGSRYLSDQGRAAIEALFERSFGPAK